MINEIEILLLSFLGILILIGMSLMICLYVNYKTTFCNQENCNGRMSTWTEGWKLFKPHSDKARQCNKCGFVEYDNENWFM